MVQIFVEGLKQEIKQDINKQAWLTFNDAFRHAQNLEKLAEQKKAHIYSVQNQSGLHWFSIWKGCTSKQRPIKKRKRPK